MLAITPDAWMHPDQSSCPQLKCMRATDAPSLTHQITNNPPHSFYCSCSGRQIQFRMSPIGSERICSSQKLPYHHAHHTGSHRLLNQFFQTSEHKLQARTVWELQSLAGELIESLANGSACQVALAPPSAALQLADEMKMAQLQDPAFSHSQRGHTSDLVGDHGADALVDIDGNGIDGFRPQTDLFPTREKHRIQKPCTGSIARLQGHQIQDPRLTLEAKIKAVDQQDQWPWQVQLSGLGHILTHCLLETVTQSSLGKSWVTPCKVFQSPAVQQNGLQKSVWGSPTRTSPLFPANSPRPFAVTALATSRTKTVYGCSTTTRFRVQRLHARELCSYSQPKWVKYQ